MGMTVVWSEALDRLRAAGTEREALQATAELIDEVVDGGVAVAEAAAPAAASIISDLGNRREFRICSLWVLVEIARCIGLWAKTARGKDAPNIRAAVEHEAHVASVLATGQHAYVSLMSDHEADVRSMAYLLTGLCAPEPAVAARLLAEHERVETHRLARACARQGVLVAVARAKAEEREPALVESVREYVRSGTSEDRGRLRRVVEEHSGVGLPPAAREVLGATVTLLSDPEGPFWPIENL
ncbi:hypothetical protein FGE12_08875 [Aggregicoccus sp. 17bor-14]|uniref:hypothetical protein n=1 Tax=Myxococcaceae TaxID=31 RepID=UPI00129C3053|nr:MULTISPECIES: hypothetical protein [Myxococcaceae]MBF5042512.1 hypothetical protein [Simulacricoccus sp. 17bor-14]MRI88282.1 hypothetical protein [Aggregicoccus sp. 17bor-14]